MGLVRPHHPHLRSRKTMTSVKCLSCGLVNFSTEPSCKRCKEPLADNGGSTQQQFQSFQEPPPPPVFYGEATVREHAPPCIKCGNRTSIAIREFKKDYSSPFALLGIFLGILPALLLALLLRTRHQISAPFCDGCWSRFKHADTFRTLLVLGIIPAIILVIGLTIYTGSITVMLIGFIGMLIGYSLLSRHIKSISPKFKKVTAKEVIIEAPFQGDLVFARK